MSESNRPEELPPDKLQYHPKSIETYGEPNPPEHLVEDIGGNGIANPIVVTENSHYANGVVIISGHHRTESANRKDQNVPVGKWKEYEYSEDELADVLRYNDYRNKSFSQKMSEADIIQNLEEAAAEGRMQNPLQNFGRVAKSSRVCLW